MKQLNLFPLGANLQKLKRYLKVWRKRYLILCWQCKIGSTFLKKQFDRSYKNFKKTCFDLADTPQGICNILVREHRLI